MMQRKTWITFHRRMGWLFAPFLLILAVTGWILLRNESWSLDQRAVPHWIEHTVYNVPTVEWTSYEVHDQKWTYASDVLYWRESVALPIHAAPIAILKSPWGWLIADREKIILLNEAGEVLDRLNCGVGLDLSPPIAHVWLSQDGNNTHVQNATEHISSADLLNWKKENSIERQESLPQLQPIANAQIPLSLASPEGSGSRIHWERFLLDLHSGRVLGDFGMWMMELSAWAMVLLAMSGMGLSVKWRRNKNTRT